MKQRREQNERLLNTIRDLIHSLEDKKLKEILEEMHFVDVSDTLLSLKNEKDQSYLLSLLDNELAADVLNELETELVVELLENLPHNRISGILEKMPFDDVADFLGELPEEEQDKFLKLLRAHDAADVQELMDYDEDSAGGLMTTEYVAIPENITAAKAIEVLRDIAPDAETVYYVYVINLKNQLVGVISLRELIVTSPDSLILEIMRKKFISVNVCEDQEVVANLVSKYDILAIPVVDDLNHLVGIITVDDVIDVIHEEATEDIYRLAGTYSGEEEVTAKYLTAIKSRLPWLLVTMLGGLFSGHVLGKFSDQLSAVVALAFFIPLLTGMGGNVGTQSSTVTVRGIATGQINPNTVIKTILRESMVGVSLGLVLGSMVALVAYVWQGSIALGVVVGLAMLGNMFTAATMGTLVPIIFKKVGVDPAVASAPFITTSIDIVGLIIYSTLATLLLNYML
ncbi:magnesium transporter [Desulfonispora thiosulfatigenes DSM 11270]|uniref:Magnesium transporter MgtE n=1 Tax=Desulfonispora thiosulfatigenes DSM 11270 TaxID=656914 RepID=A0A1W1VC76_DESTI|nr:magnesium transporter [Desulfonispora thiosulfatigenes]SMB91009.1 magnesium transporter [Desulfonispora thiosulfatigenes DSM 11270]